MQTIPRTRVSAHGNVDLKNVRDFHLIIEVFDSVILRKR